MTVITGGVDVQVAGQILGSLEFCVLPIVFALVDAQPCLNYDVGMLCNRWSRIGRF